MSSEPKPIPEEDGSSRRGRPTPVRVIMEGGADETPDAARSFEADGDEWVARITGSTSAGTAPDVRAPILLIGFARAVEPGAIEREAMAPGLSLDDVSDDDLTVLLAGSRAARHSEGPADPS